jgi:hypothetical protein
MDMAGKIVVEERRLIFLVCRECEKNVYDIKWVKIE